MKKETLRRAGSIKIISVHPCTETPIDNYVNKGNYLLRANVNYYYSTIDESNRKVIEFVMNQ